MKRFRLWLMLTLLSCNYFACTKNEIMPPVVAEDPCISESITYLRNHASAEDFDSMDFTDYQLISIAGSKNLVARFFDRNDHQKSVTMVKTDKGLTGNWLRMRAGEHAGDEIWNSASLDRKKESSIHIAGKAVVRVDSKESGKVTSMRLKAGSRNIFVGDNPLIAEKRNPDDDQAGQWLPEYVVIGYSRTDFTSFFSLFWLSDMNPLFIHSYLPGNIYINPEESGGGMEGLRPTEENMEAVEVEEFQFEHGIEINLKQVFKCFDKIPSAGAKYGIAIYADLPINDDPSRLLDGFTPGHSFVSLTKKNGNNSITQVFGFYPRSGMFSVFNLPLQSKMYDNGSHELNGKLEMEDISEIDFKAAGNLAIYLGENRSYDLNDYNCTNYALEIFNKARPLNNQIFFPTGWVAI